MIAQTHHYLSPENETAGWRRTRIADVFWDCDYALLLRCVLFLCAQWPPYNSWFFFKKNYALILHYPACRRLTLPLSLASFNFNFWLKGYLVRNIPASKYSSISWISQIQIQSSSLGVSNIPSLVLLLIERVAWFLTLNNLLEDF